MLDMCISCQRYRSNNTYCVQLQPPLLRSTRTDSADDAENDHEAPGQIRSIYSVFITNTSRTEKDALRDAQASPFGVPRDGARAISLNVFPASCRSKVSYKMSASSSLLSSYTSFMSLVSAPLHEALPIHQQMKSSTKP